MNIHGLRLNLRDDILLIDLAAVLQDTLDAAAGPVDGVLVLADTVSYSYSWPHSDHLQQTIEKVIVAENWLCN